MQYAMPFIVAMIVAMAWLPLLAKVAAKCLRRSGMIAALLFAPLAPALEERAGLDDAGRSDDATLANEGADWGPEVLELLDGFAR